MHRWERGLLALSLLACANPVFAQDGVAQLKAEVDELRVTVKALQSEVQALKAQQAKPSGLQASAETGAVAPPASPRPATESVQSVAAQAVPGQDVLAEVPRSPLPGRQSVSDNPAGASRIDNQAPPTNPELKGFMAIPGTDTVFRLGGYAKLDAIYDTRPAGNADQFVVASIPAPNGADSGGNFNMQARQTRFSFEVRRPSALGGTMRFYMESDFYGGGDGKYDFHLRQAFGQLGNTYGGYGYSAFMDADALPDTLDFAGPGGQLFVLQPGVRQAFRLGASSSLTVSLEKPHSEVSAIGQDGDAHGTQRLPDVVLSARTERDWGHVQLGLVARRLGYADDVREGHATGFGAALTGVVNVTDRGENNDLLMFGGTWGRGIAHYISDMGDSGLDAVVDGRGRLHALAAWGAYGAYTHYWNQDWRSNLVYGVARVQGSSWLSGDALRESRYGAVNLIWSPFSTMTVGLEVLHGRLERQSGVASDATRIQGSLLYNFVN